MRERIPGPSRSPLGHGYGPYTSTWAAPPKRGTICVGSGLASRFGLATT